MRCAVYTRKSTEDGLEQEFNSLDAQYDACSAYAVSQRHEGWVLVENRYDDGGFSGGTMARPGLKRLLSDIEDGKVDIILLYKIDRLTRSLTDFARIVEILDKAGASFVSITQSFNTTTSMGRLTLNMLLSFAQFEREVTGERIRDKIAASKKKGLWMGGPVPLGYDVQDRKLVVNKREAEQVRHIVRRYLELGSVPALVEELEREGYRTKIQHRTSGPHRGGCVFQRGTLYHLLSNRIYRGFIVHKGEAYPGEHQPIVDEDLWNQVQALLAHNASGTSRRLGHKHPSLLTEKVCDGEGRAMTPSHTHRSNKRYRYYVTRPEAVDGSSAWRVSAHDLEHLVCTAVADRLDEQGFALNLTGTDSARAVELQRVMANAKLAAGTLRGTSPHAKADILAVLVERVALFDERVEIRLDASGLQESLGLRTEVDPASIDLTVTVAAVKVRRGHQLRLIIPGAQQQREAPAKPNQHLIALMAEAQEARNLVVANPEHSLARIARDHRRCRTRLGKLVSLSCIAPDIVTAIAQGRQPKTLTRHSLLKATLPLAWTEQRRMLGFS